MACFGKEDVYVAWGVFQACAKSLGRKYGFVLYCLLTRKTSCGILY
ncbi:hypothetical protein ARMA_0248 [Ardenticatena maritima]|uniref:Uncharacterized protein n=1 Tax=Ardenticatena maritima TaxID=872965 RepID=A0A0M8K553_9CHLR|nr:hypothetical protein ARMA_0248 [Ardenticatena maritima]